MNRELITLKQIEEILTDQDRRHLESLARQSARLTRQYFGRTISLYAPIYLSNYCSSHCTYCGFSSHNKIHRVRLTSEQIQQEMIRVAGTGIESILLLTGESYEATPLSYLKDAVQIAKQHFSSISLEVHPLESDDYRELFKMGVDGITIYQETYDRERYAEVHLAGTKRDYDYRIATPERVARSGIRMVSLGILLGLGPLAKDLLDLYHHMQFMEKNFPGIEYSFSFPRFRQVKGVEAPPAPVDDLTFIKIICLSRILFPRVGINLSTRESEKIRDHALQLGVTRMSAGSSTAVGGYALFPSEDQAPQFDVSDHRSLQDIIQLLKAKNFDPVLTEWRRLDNATLNTRA